MSDFLKIKRMFFTSDGVRNLLDRKTARALSRFGAATRSYAQRSMRSKKGKAPAGTAPYAHNRKLLRKLLFFAFDGSRSVVVGPILKDSTKRLGIPRTHEKGGTITGRGRKGEVVVSKYPARPYIAPAGAEYAPKIAEWYANG